MAAPSPQNGSVVYLRGVEQAADSEESAYSDADPADQLKTLAHDLKTPLTAIYGHAQLLLRRATREDRVSDISGLTKIVEQVRAMTEMITAIERSEGS